MNLLSFIQSGFRKSKCFCIAHKDGLNALFGVPAFVLSSLDFKDIPLYTIILLSLIFILIAIYEIFIKNPQHRWHAALKCVKGHVIAAPMFWAILGGSLSLAMTAHNNKVQMSKDFEEFQLTYEQYQRAVLNMPIYSTAEERSFILGYQFLREGKFSKAAQLLKKVSDKYPFAAYFYGRTLYYGFGDRGDKYEAIRYWERASEKEVMEAKYDLMIHYLEIGDFETAEQYALDMLKKSSFGLPGFIVRDQKKTQIIGDEIALPLIRKYDSAYHDFLTYYWRTRRFRDAAEISDMLNKGFYKGNAYQYEINKALSWMLDGDVIRARRHFKKLIRKDAPGKGMKEMATNYYVQNMLMPSDSVNWKRQKVKEAEKLLIKNIKNGNVKAISLLRELYERTGYKESAIEMAHFESYHKITSTHEE